MKKTCIAFAVILGIVCLAGFIIWMTGLYRPEGSEGIGPRGGHWHITSGGRKSYYQPKTSDWGITKTTEIGVLGRTMFILSGIAMIISIVMASYADDIKNHYKNNR